MKTIYRAVGDVRGSCGHDHRTLSGAEKCAERDGNTCAKMGGGCYSDRCVRAYDEIPPRIGTMIELRERDLTEAEADQLDALRLARATT